MFARLLGLRTISPRKLHQTMQERQITVVDVNSRESWLEAHVPGAIRLDPSDYSEHELPSDRDGTVVFYCSNVMCRKAPNAARRARRMGYNNVIVMSAGIRGWLSSALPAETDT